MMDVDCVYLDEDVGDMDDVLEVYCCCVRGYGYADTIVNGTGVVCRQRDACVKLMETLATNGSETDVSALSADEGSDWWSFPECRHQQEKEIPMLSIREGNWLHPSYPTEFQNYENHLQKLASFFVFV